MSAESPPTVPFETRLYIIRSWNLLHPHLHDVYIALPANRNSLSCDFLLQPNSCLVTMTVEAHVRCLAQAEKRVDNARHLEILYTMTLRSLGADLAYPFTDIRYSVSARRFILQAVDGLLGG